MQAQFEIGEKYYEARYSFFGKSEYWEDAVRWYKMAASQGDPRTHYRLAQYYFTVRSDYSQSFKWLELPAQQGIAEAQNFLGMHYAQAWGAPLNLVSAYKWIALSHEGGVPDPIGRTPDVEWLVSRGKLSPEMITEGQRLAEVHTAAYGKARSIELIK
jgi:TPR repeat protein